MTIGKGRRRGSSGANADTDVKTQGQEEAPAEEASGRAEEADQPRQAEAATDKRAANRAGKSRRNGMATVAFAIDRSGRGLSSHLVGSSSDPALDAEAISLPKRAHPVPPPSPSFGGGNTITQTVPIRFDR